MQKKLLVLGVPYFTFSLITWLSKTVLANSVNDQVGGLFETLFLTPAQPYWYLYCLFLLFLITPTFRNRGMAAVWLLGASLMKYLALNGWGVSIYIVAAVLKNEIWFVMGICLGMIFMTGGYAWKPVKVWISTGLGNMFIALSILLAYVDDERISFLLGVLACVTVIELARGLDMDRQKKNRKQNTAFAFLSKYTLPIYVMHTLFAAPLRIVLLRMGVENGAVHVIAGIMISFIGPIVAAEIMKKTKVLEFFLYPGKFVKV